MPSPPNEQVLAAFFDYLKVEKGLARLTVTAYRNDLLQFAEHLGGGACAPAGRRPLDRLRAEGRLSSFRECAA